MHPADYEIAVAIVTEADRIALAREQDMADYLARRTGYETIAALGRALPKTKKR